MFLRLLPRITVTNSSVTTLNYILISICVLNRLLLWVHLVVLWICTALLYYSALYFSFESTRLDILLACKCYSGLIEIFDTSVNYWASVKRLDTIWSNSRAARVTACVCVCHVMLMCELTHYIGLITAVWWVIDSVWLCEIVYMELLCTTRGVSSVELLRNW
jgi:hypothetical protein